MTPPSAEDLLRVWEENRDAHPVRRALHALAAATPEVAGDAWSRAPIGARDGALFALHEQLFGSALHTTAVCPACGERLESEFSTRDIRSQGASLPDPAAELRLQDQGFDIEYRLPTSEDLLHIAAGDSEPAGGVDALLRRCVSSASRGDTAVDPATLPADLIERITEGMAQQDPDADVHVALACPACGTAWQLHFDIVSYFWSELDDWAQRILADVHALACAYGWTEREILALSPARRQVYLEMIGA